jgi:tetratricopeptide (TPR) repeat protein
VWGAGFQKKKTVPESGLEGNGASADSASVALALAGASREEADLFLKKHGALADDQRLHLHEQLTQIHLNIFEKWLGVLLRLATLCVGLAAATGVGMIVWDAAHSNGLVIEPFAVPLDMATKGLSGEVIASQMLDKLAVMQDATDSARPPQSYANNWGNNIKVEIPETGVSIGELQSFLKAWLGHDTHISGEVWRTQTEIAVTARQNGEAGATFFGPESDLDALMQKAAEHIYSVTQPYRYANFILAQTGSARGSARATAIYRKLLAAPSALEQAWAWNGLGTLESGPNPLLSMYYYAKSIEAKADFSPGYAGLGFEEYFLGRYESSLSHHLAGKRLLDRTYVSDVNPSQLPVRRTKNEALVAMERGDLKESLRYFKISAQSPRFANLNHDQFPRGAFGALGRLHDGGGVRGYMLDLGISSIEQRFGSMWAVAVDGGLEDWPSILQIEKAVPEGTRQRLYQTYPGVLATISLAHAYSGDPKGAEILVEHCDLNSDDCMIARGQIATFQGEPGRADYWFARVAKAEPSVPFADYAWGRSLLDHGKPDDAIAKFTLGNQKGPHFADPLEGWGEALMAKNQSHLALAKFGEAEKYAPNWGRLHLKWGEALVYAGKKDEAAEQFSRAARLDLTPAEKSELAAWVAGPISNRKEGHAKDRHRISDFA